MGNLQFRIALALEIPPTCDPLQHRFSAFGAVRRATCMLGFTSFLETAGPMSTPQPFVCCARPSYLPWNALEQEAPRVTDVHPRAAGVPRCIT